MTGAIRALMDWAMKCLGAVALFSMALGVFAMPAQATSINLVQNGNFLATSLTSPGGFICKAGTTCTSTVSNWESTCNRNSCGTGETVATLLYPGTNGSVFNNNNGLWGTIPDAPGGGNTIAIDGDPQYSGSISQTLSGLQVGKTYILTFEQAAAQQKNTSGATTERWAVSLGSTTQNSTLMINPSHGVQAWNSQTMSFVATSSSEVLTFLAVGTPGGEPPVSLLSGVEFSSSVPEPASWAMMLAGMGAIGYAMRRRSDRAAVVA